MRVHLIKKQTIENYVTQNSRSRDAFGSWLAVIKYVEWKSPEDIVLTFNHADILGRGSNRIVFNIGGNKHRMICQYMFGENMVHLFVNWIGTHSEYDKLCKQGRQYEVDKY